MYHCLRTYIYFKSFLSFKSLRLMSLSWNQHRYFSRQNQSIIHHSMSLLTEPPSADNDPNKANFDNGMMSADCGINELYLIPVIRRELHILIKRRFFTPNKLGG